MEWRRCSDSLTERLISAVLEVSNTLGAGFLEKADERALAKELSLRGIHALPQASFSIGYKGHYVGEYYADVRLGDEHNRGFAYYATSRTRRGAFSVQPPAFGARRRLHPSSRSLKPDG